MPIQITPLCCGEIGENAYLVCRTDRDDCVMIDPGDEAGKLLRAIGARRLSAILLTHGHFDHILAVAPLCAATGAPVYVGEPDLPMLNDPAINGLMSLMGEDEMPGDPIAAAPYGEALSAAGLDFRVLPTPGHTKGSVCLYLKDEGVLFTGDTLFCGGFGRMDLPGGSPLDMRHSLRALFALPPEVRCFTGHGTDTTIGDEKRRYRL